MLYVRLLNFYVKCYVFFACSFLICIKKNVLLQRKFHGRNIYYFWTIDFLFCKQETDARRKSAES